MVSTILTTQIVPRKVITYIAQHFDKETITHHKDATSSSTHSGTMQIPDLPGLIIEEE